VNLGLGLSPVGNYFFGAQVGLNMPIFPDLIFGTLALALMAAALSAYKLGFSGAKVRTVRDYGLMLFALFILQTNVARACVVPTGSMEPTVQVQDRLFVNVISTKLSGVQRGDVVMFQSPESDKILLKRIVAVAGDTVETRGGQLWINGSAQTEPYLADRTKGEFGPVQVPAGRLFMMGDNRNNSRDSRFFGAVPADSVLGRADFVVWPIGRFGMKVKP
jgi:signal peptidase I